MGRTESQLIALARTQGIALTVADRVPWLTVHGHLAPIVQARAPRGTVQALDAIFELLGGDRRRLLDKRGGASPTPDARLDGEAIVEIDEVQHFTSDRLTTLRMYPANAPLRFDLALYMSMCEWWHTSADRYRAAKQTREFPRPGGRRAQRAYFDACRDLLAPVFDCGAVIRIAAPECDPDVAFERARSALRGGGGDDRRLHRGDPQPSRDRALPRPSPSRPHA